MQPDARLSEMSPKTIAHLLRHHANDTSDYGEMAAVEMLVGYADGRLLRDHPELRQHMRLTATGAEVDWYAVAQWAGTADRDRLSPARQAALGFAFSLATGIPGMGMPALFRHFDGHNKAIALRAAYVAAGGYDLDAGGNWLTNINTARDEYLAGYGPTEGGRIFHDFIERGTAAQRAADEAIRATAANDGREGPG